MALPLYQGLHAPAKPDHSSHMGLWFERYFSAYPSGFDGVDENARSEWLKTCTRHNYGEQFKSRLLDKAVRTLNMVRSSAGDARIFRCAGRFVTGTGNAHPMENGFTWHPTLGMPYLPGSAVKGLVRAVIETALDDSDEERKRLLKLWFGTEAKNDVAEQAGALIFLDALPVAPCDLKAEVLTPHMGKWYEKGGKDPLKADTMPGDWHSPVPVTWLVASNLQLQFAILPRPGAAAVALDDVWEALEYGLSKVGAGAKTAIGFGLFEFEASLQEQINRRLESEQQQQAEALATQQRELIMASASPVRRRILKLKEELDLLKVAVKPGSHEHGALFISLEESTETVASEGSAEERSELLALIQSAKDKKFVVSSKKEKEYKAMLAKLRN